MKAGRIGWMEKGKDGRIEQMEKGKDARRRVKDGDDKRVDEEE